MDTNKRKMLFVLRTSKTHGYESPPQMITIASTKLKQASGPDQPNNNRYCPYSLLRKYGKRRGPFSSDTEPFFVFSDGSPVTPRHMTESLRKMLKKCGEDPCLFCTHSLRKGRSCDMLRLGLSVETIKKLGHWMSNAVFKYLKHS